MVMKGSMSPLHRFLRTRATGQGLVGQPRATRWLWLGTMLVVFMVTTEHLRARRVFEVAKPTENIRSSPEGLRLGVLEKGTQIEEVGRDGQWVKFEFTGWIWGPSLEGFEDITSERSSSIPTDEENDEGPGDRSERQPRQALNVHLDDVRDLINEDFGRFYGLSLDAELGRVTLRFRVPDVGEPALLRRQMRAQARVDVVLAADVSYEELRVETNRPDGTGAVGQYVAIADTATIRRIAAKDLDAWIESVQRSDDGGQTWK